MSIHLHDIPSPGAKLTIRDGNDIFGAMQNGNYEVEETKLVRSILKRDWTCFDIGANIGYYTILMARLAKFVYAFEPEPSNAELWLKNIEQNQLWGKTSLFANAVGVHYSLSNLYRAKPEYNGSHGMHRMYKSKWCIDKPLEVEVISIDDELPDVAVHFVKIDVEGSEYPVLVGMSHTIDKFHPIILMEFHPPALEEAGTRPENVYNFLVKKGYIIKLVPDLLIPDYETLDRLTRTEGGGQNIICQ